HSWRVTQHRRNVDPRKKAQLLRALLGWAQRHGFREEGLRILRQSWPDTSFAEADARLWAERLGASLAEAEPGGPIGGVPAEAPGPDGCGPAARRGAPSD